MTISEIQSKINSLQKYIPYGSGVNLYFQPGTYNFGVGEAIEIRGFFGGGSLILQSTTTENPNTAYATQSVVFAQNNSANGAMFYFENNQLSILQVYRIKFLISTNNGRAFWAYRSTFGTQYCSFLRNGNGGGTDLQALRIEKNSRLNFSLWEVSLLFFSNINICVFSIAADGILQGDKTTNCSTYISANACSSLRVNDTNNVYGASIDANSGSLVVGPKGLKTGF